MNINDIYSHALVFGFGKVESGFFEYYIRAKASSQSDRQYIVTDGFNSCWHKGLNEFVDEPFPSEQDEEFKENTRFRLGDAVGIVGKLLGEVVE